MNATNCGPYSQYHGLGGGKGKYGMSSAQCRCGIKRQSHSRERKFHWLTGTFRSELPPRCPSAAAPTLIELRITAAAHGNQPPMSSCCNVKSASNPLRRQYTPKDQASLLIVRKRSRAAGATPCTMLWTHTNTVVPAFVWHRVVDLHVPCTSDSNIAAAKYF